MNLECLWESEFNDRAEIKNQLQYMKRAANESYELIRTMLAVLKTGSSKDPLSLFTRYAEQISERSSLEFEIHSRGNPEELSPQQIHQLCYIFREALSDIEKYAKAKHVRVEFCWEENGLTLVIADDGCGFTLDTVQTSHQYGLQFMRQRAELLKGSISIQSASGQGTQVTVVIPYMYELSTLSQ